MRLRGAEKSEEMPHKMSEKKSCIYEIYKWMGAVGKFTGCFPLPGLYEKKEWSKCTKAFINYVIPALNFSCCFFSVIMMFVDYRRHFQHDLTDLLIFITECATCLHFIQSLLLNQLSLRRSLVSYLQQHEKLDELLQPKKMQLKRLIALFFSFLISLQFLHLMLIRNNTGDHSEIELFRAHPVRWMIVNLIKVSLHLTITISISTHPQLMYVCFQHILKSAFDELLVKIEKNKNEKLSREMRVKKMRKYTRLYCHLSRLSTRLDHMVSPLMLICFTQHYIDQIFSFTFLNRSFSVDNYARLASIVLRCVSLVLVPNSAYLTKKSNTKIQSAINSTFESEDKVIQAEWQNFALQSMYFNKSFSASGFFKLDRQLILTIFDSIISQVVVFTKIAYAKKKC